MKKRQRKSLTSMRKPKSANPNPFPYQQPAKKERELKEKEMNSATEAKAAKGDREGRWVEV